MQDVALWMWALAWVPAAIVAGEFVGYCLIVLVAKPRPAPHDAFTPELTVVLPAHDESGHIATKLRELLASDYPHERMRIVVVDDGSQDGTADEVERVRDPRIQLLSLPQRSGKVAAIRAGLAVCRTDIVIGTDATAGTEPESIRRLVAWLGDAAVGGVTARVEVANRTESLLTRCQSFILTLQNAIKQGESALDSAAGLSGPLYAYRLSALGDVDPATVLEDRIFAIQLRERGHPVRYAHDAVVHYRSAASRRDFSRQKTRIMGGAFESLARFGGMLFRPRYGLYGMLILPEYMLFRTARPFLLGLSAFSLAGLWPLVGIGSASLEAIRIGAVLIGALGLVCLLAMPRVPDAGRFLRDAVAAPPGLVLLLASTVLGGLTFGRGRHAATWHRVDRSSTAAEREAP